MSHLSPNAAIFSPSVARAAASVAQDWACVDAWLASRFQNHAGPPQIFERNTDTLRALLSLVAANEAADEERHLVARVEASALQDLKDREAAQADQTNVATAAAAAILDAIEDHLPREGHSALDVLSCTAAELDLLTSSLPDANSAVSPAYILGQQLVALQAQAHDLDQSILRTATLHRHLGAEFRDASTLLDELRGPDDSESLYIPSPHLAKRNLETQRRIKALSTKLPGLRERVDTLASSVGLPEPTIQQVRAEEEEYLRLLARKKELDAQMRSFEGLPPDTKEARRKLEELRAELRRSTQRRDAVFEGLVERETPKRARR